MDDVLKLSVIQRESQAVLDSIKENGFNSASETWKNDVISVYVPKETSLKQMPAKIKLSQDFSFDLVWELSDSTSYE
jgi:hypothetical protein